MRTPYEGESTADELVFETERLRATLISEDDAADAFALLTHERLEFLDPEFQPPSAEAFVHFAQRVRMRADNQEDAWLYQWALRHRETKTLVGLRRVRSRSRLSYDRTAKRH